MDENKKPFSDKWWTQPLGGIVVDQREITKEEKKETDEFVKKYFEELEKITKVEIILYSNNKYNTIQHFAVDCRVLFLCLFLGGGIYG